MDSKCILLLSILQLPWLFVNVSDAAPCASRCVARFGQCHSFLRRKRGKTDNDAYSICRRTIDKGLFDSCIPACDDTDEMLDLIDQDDASPCSQSCVKQFKRCFNYRKNRRKKTCQQAYDTCRRGIDNGFRRLANAGCVTSCLDTEEMNNLKTCGVNPGPTTRTTTTKTTITTGAACTPGMVFASNAKGNMQILCKSNLCETFQNERGDACQVKMDVPENCAGEAGKTCSLLFYFHGSGGSNKRAAYADQVRREGLATGFIAIYPQGADRKWNLGAQTGPLVEKTDEGKFVTAIVSVLREYYDWDGFKFAAGSSNGGGQSNRIAVNSGYDFDGVVASATQLIASPETSGVGEFNKNTITETTVPIAYLNLHGSNDRVIPAEGGQLFKTDFTLSSVADTLKDFAALNNCLDVDSPTVQTVPAVVESGASSTATVTKYNCDPNVPVEGVMIQGGKHGVGRSIDGKSKKDYVFDWLLALRDNL